MTNRISNLTVVLERDIREDDAAALIAAIGQLRGVLSVSSGVTDITQHVAEMRVRRELSDALWSVLNQKS